MECPRCSQISPMGARYCSECGAPLRPEHSPLSDPVKVTFGTGEFKPTTILFADIVASTELVSDLDPEEAMHRLAPAVALMRRAVERSGGTIMHMLGDGIMAVFGAPRAQEGHALMACRAALAIQSEFPTRAGGPSVRVGLHSGTIVSETNLPGMINEREAYGVAIHIASRMQSLADPGKILLSEDCYQLVRRFCTARSIGRRSVRGISQEIEVYELHDLTSHVPDPSLADSALTKFLGREKEIAILESSLRRMQSGEGHIVGICGAPGSGKSRVCYEFLQHCRELRIPTIEVRTQPYGSATPFQPVLEIMRILFGIQPSVDASHARDRVATSLARIGPNLDGTYELICEFLGIAENAASSALAPKTRHAYLLDVMSHLIRDRGKSPLVILFEDLHWLDEASEGFVETICTAISGTQVLLIVNYRPNYSAPGMKRKDFTQILLDDLGSDQTRVLAEALIGPDAALAELRERVAERCGGNPFFAEELVHSLAENGRLVGTTGHYRLVARSSDIPLPVTVQAVIGERLDRLAIADRTVIQVASVIGKEVPYAVLAEVLGGARFETDVVLDHLCSAELLKVLHSPEGTQYAFRHPLIQEVAYAGQLKARRSRLHGLVAPAMEAYYRERRDEAAGLICFHYEAAGNLAAAAQYGKRAAEWIGSMHPAQAIKQWQDVLRLLRDQPRSPENASLRTLANAQVAWLGWREGMTSEQAQPFIQEALVIARATDDSMIPLLLFVEARIGGASGGPADDYVAQVKKALTILSGADQGRAATLFASLCQAYGWAGLFREALQANDEAMIRLPHVTDFDNRFLGYSVEHWTISLRARIFVHIDRIDEGRKWLDHMLAIDDGLIDPTVQFISHLGYVDLAWITGDAELAATHAAQVMEIAARHGTPYLRVFSHACAGIAMTIAGQTADAVREFEAGLAFMQSARAAVDYEPDMLAALAECLDQAGSYGKALTTAEHAIRISRERAARLPECRAQIVAGSALLKQFGVLRSVEARRHFETAEMLIEVTGATVLEPRLRLARGLLDSTAS